MHKAGCKIDLVAHVGIVDTEQVRIFIAHSEHACRRNSHNRAIVFVDRLAYRRHVERGLLLRLIDQSVGNQSHATALLLIKEMHTIAESVGYSHEILAELRIVVVDIATMEKADMLLKRILTRFGVALEPRFEFLSGIFRERAVTVDLKHAVHHHLHWLQAKREIGHRSDHRGECAHKISVGKQLVAE